MNSADEGGTTVRQHMDQAGIEMEEPETHPRFGYLMGWAFRLAGRAGSGGFGRNPVSFQDMEAWSRLTGIRPEPWEVAALERLDNAMLAESANQVKFKT